MPKVITTQEFIERAQAKFPLLDFSQSVYQGSLHPIQFVCPKHGPHTVSKAGTIMRKDRGACPVCSKIAAAQGNKNAVGHEVTSEHKRRISEGMRNYWAERRAVNP